jgi:hypothetical protein
LYVNGNVGVGTTTALGKLDIRPDASWPTAEAIIFDTDGSNNPRIRLYRPGGGDSTTAYPIHLRNDSGALNILTTTATTLGSETVSSKLLLKADGNLGIGTTSPAYKLEVSGTGYFLNNLTANGVTIGSSDIRSSSNILTLGGTSEIIRITGGNVGIGTTSPAHKLDIVGAIRSTSSIINTSGNLNSLNDNGSYAGNTLTNSPNGSGWIFVNNYTNRLSSGDQYFQIAYDQYAAGKLYTRYSADSGSTWSSWKTIINSDAVSGTSNYVAKFTGTNTVGNSIIYDTGTYLSFGTTQVYNSSRVSIIDLFAKTSSGNCLTFGTATGGTSDFEFIISRSSNTDGYYSLQAVEQNVGYKNIVLNASGGNVGIGTTSPTFKLFVNGGIGIPTNNVINFGSASQIYYNSTSAGLQFTGSSGNNTLFIKAADGNVGIGTTSPAAKLEVQSSILLRGDGTNSFGVSFASAGENTFFLTHSGSTNTFLLGNDVSGTNYTTMTLTAAASSAGGNVGIGTTSPTTKLAVSDGTTVAQVNPSSGVAYFGTVNNYPMALSVNSSEKVRIDTGGNVGIGTTSPAATLHVTGAVRFASLPAATGPNVVYIASNGDLTSGVAPAGGGGSVSLSGPNNGVVTRDGAAGTTLVAETNFTYDANGTGYLSGKFGINFTGATNPFEVYGTSGQLFTLTDNISGSIFSVNDVAGLPVIDAYSNSTIILGEYGSGDLTVTGNKIGIGTLSPNEKVQVLGTGGELFTVTDDLTSSLLSVNNIAGLPVFEVFANNTVTAGQYGSGDFIITGNRIGIGTTTPSAKLHTSGTVRLQGLASGTGAGVVYIDGNGNLTSGVAPQGGGGGGSVTLSGPNNGIVTRDGAAGTTLIAETNYEFNASTRLMYMSGQIGINFTGNTGAANPLKIHGTGGELFAVDDDLSSSLMSVNTIAGLPVFEAFADSTLQLGQYGSGDMTITGNKVGIGFLPTNLSSITAKLHVSGNTTIVGTLSKTAGTFEINHPDPIKNQSGYKLRHSFVESPTRGDNIYRYQVEIDNKLSFELDLPDYWKYLNENPQVWVNPVNCFGVGYGTVDEELEKLNIYTNMSGLYNVLLIGTRKDIDAKQMFDAQGIEYI